jgi:hypothetical protein
MAAAHVPFLEEEDYTEAAPFEVRDVDQSKALYGWLADEDVDFYSMELAEPALIYTHTLVPRCREYRDFPVHYALTGPGMPEPSVSLPFELPPGHGAIVVRDERAGGPARPVTYEQFSARHYFEGPELEYEARVPGTYRMVVWSDGGEGDYVAVIGRAEKFGPADIVRAVRHTPTLRRAGELRGSCSDPDEVVVAGE